MSPSSSARTRVLDGGRRRAAARVGDGPRRRVVGVGGEEPRARATGVRGRVGVVGLEWRDRTRRARLRSCRRRSAPHRGRLRRSPPAVSRGSGAGRSRPPTPRRRGRRRAPRRVGGSGGSALRRSSPKPTRKSADREHRDHGRVLRRAVVPGDPRRREGLLLQGQLLASVCEASREALLTVRDRNGSLRDAEVALDLTAAGEGSPRPRPGSAPPRSSGRRKGRKSRSRRQVGLEAPRRVLSDHVRAHRRDGDPGRLAGAVRLVDARVHSAGSRAPPRAPRPPRA